MDEKDKKEEEKKTEEELNEELNSFLEEEREKTKTLGFCILMWAYIKTIIFIFF